MVKSDPRQSAKIAQNQDGRSIHGIMKTMCPPGYDFVATHALIAMMLMSCSCNSASAAGTGIGYEGCSGIVFLSPCSSVDFNVTSFLIIFFSNLRGDYRNGFFFVRIDLQ